MNKISALKSTLAATATLALATAGIAVSSAPAQAALDCTTTVCIWQDEDYQNYKWGWAGSTGYVGDSANDEASSAHNRANRNIRFYDDLNYAGEWLELNAGETVGRMSSYAFTGCVFCLNWDNKASSISA
jgi:hypothetical protein